MTLILTSPLQKSLPSLSPAVSHQQWGKMIHDYIHQNETNIEKLIQHIDDNVLILEHQKERTSLIMAILEEAGGLTVRARNLMSTPADIQKYQKSITEFEDWFKLTLIKLDKTVTESVFKNINLMNGDSLITAYDAKGQNQLITAGLQLTSTALGIRPPDFKTLFSVQNSRIDVMNAIDILVTVRNTIASHITNLMISRDFAVQSIDMAQKSYAPLSTTSLDAEINALKKLNDLGTKIIGDDALADAPQQDILNSFASSPNMEDI